MKKLLFVLATALMLVSCASKDGMLYRTLMYGFVLEDGSLYADDGCTYTFNNLSSFTQLPEPEDRILALFDVVEAEEGSETRFRAMLLQYVLPLYKPVDLCGSDAEIERYGQDPINISALGYSGGCINMENEIVVISGSDVKHLVSLVHDGARSSEDTVKFVLCHDAGDDAVVKDFDITARYGFYSSFPIRDLLPEKDSFVLEIKYFWGDEWHKQYKTIGK